jgi:hypothetical protein
MTGFLVPSVVASINAAQVGIGGPGAAGRTPDHTASPAPSDRGDAGGNEESPDGDGDRANDTRIAPRAADSIDSLLGPGRFVTAAILVAAILACGGLGVALWSLSRSARHMTGS